MLRSLCVLSTLAVSHGATCVVGTTMKFTSSSCTGNPPPIPAPVPTPCAGSCITTTATFSTFFGQSSCTASVSTTECSNELTADGCSYVAAQTPNQPCTIAAPDFAKIGAVSTCKVSCAGGTAPLCTPGTANCYAIYVFGTLNCEGNAQNRVYTLLNGKCQTVAGVNAQGAVSGGTINEKVGIFPPSCVEYPSFLSDFASCLLVAFYVDMHIVRGG